MGLSIVKGRLVEAEGVEEGGAGGGGERGAGGEGGMYIPLLGGRGGGDGSGVKPLRHWHFRRFLIRSLTVCDGVGGSPCVCVGVCVSLCLCVLRVYMIYACHA